MELLFKTSGIYNLGMKNRAALPPTYLFNALAIMVLLHFFVPVHEITPYPWNLIGLAPLTLGIALNLLADNALKKYDTTVKPLEESTALITTGAYKISRHPMYLGMVLILIGVALLMASLSPCIVIPVFIIIMDRLFISVEERMLKNQFGDAWTAYKTKVRRWL